MPLSLRPSMSTLAEAGLQFSTPVPARKLVGGIYHTQLGITERSRIFYCILPDPLKADHNHSLESTI